MTFEPTRRLTGGYRVYDEDAVERLGLPLEVRAPAEATTMLASLLTAADSS